MSDSILAQSCNENNKHEINIATDYAAIAQKVAITAEKDAAIADRDAAIAEKNAAIAQKVATIAKKNAIIESLKVQLLNAGIEPCISTSSDIESLIAPYNY